MVTGYLTMNGINDADLVKILEIKGARGAQSLAFNPQPLQAIPPATPQQAAKPQTYNNATLGWNDRAGLEGVMEILKHIHEKQ